MAAALKAPLVALEALAAAVLGALTLQELLARVVLAVAAAVAVILVVRPAALAGPAAWRFNMPTTAMWQPET